MDPMTHASPRVELAPVGAPADLAAARELLSEYAAALDIDLEFQDFERELRELPGEYAPPGGRLLLARVGDRIAGCVAVRPFEPGCCELKRLYVRREFRGAGTGRALAEAAIEEARSAGYVRMRLDTIPSMRAARALYRKLGFREVAPYRFNPIPGTAFMELRLDESRSARR
jgi:ribosomal protein S18 acetylase RimI-like enzyme